MTKVNDDEASKDFRAAESALYRHYGLTTSESFVSVGPQRFSVRVVEIGSDSTRPPILLLHGISSVTALAVPLLPLLGDRRILAVDWPGHGLSDPFVVKAGTDLRTHVVSVIDAVLEHFQADTIDLVGHSLGGQFSLYYVEARPERVRRLVLLGAPGAGFEGVQPVPAMRIMSVPGVGRGLLSIPSSLPSYAKQSDGMLGAKALDGFPHEIAVVGWSASKRPGFARSLASFFRALITPFSMREGVAVPRETLERFTTPTLMVWGDADVFLTPARGRHNIDAIPGSTLLLVEGGHAPWLNELEAAGDAVRSFLD
ncbi:hypothetical protein AX769_03030 [Frondihabitans sp. PAMC 28766]|uniref:alpha/beta fold hydrolase n=1 Tax=Frondihabitans sp. PAMC 28766 TaxID=1795630 RepID=UPI00078D4F32|nr:alpha/beta hydrolase [Frondihabitans sp. PAMC 28766]AMM19292.1 hypothetical protein AX769_03030 [Frondihabitans sp. PAMC 28766]